MLRVIVRSKRDRDAVEAVLRNYYPDWGLEVLTLKGARSPGKVLDALEEIVKSDPHHFYVLLLGREDRETAEQLVGSGSLPPSIAVHVVGKKKVRSARLEQLARELLLARSLFRQAVGWEGNVYVFSLYRGKPLEGYGYSVYNDPFLALGGGSKRLLDSLFSRDTGGPVLMVRGESGLHRVYSGPRLLGEILVTDYGRKPRLLRDTGAPPTTIDTRRLLEENRSVLRLYVEKAVEFIRREAGGADTVVVPWSGGKDSTAVLLLALKALGGKRVKLVFTDTGTEFPHTHAYIEKVSRMLGVRVYTAYAGVDRGLLVEGMPMPSHDNRWCTGRKIEATRRAVKEIAEGETVILVGDREAESPRRAMRPPVYWDELGFKTVSPIRLWGAVHVQLFLLSEGVPLNPLYLYGFYRVGCYMCPALRSWEVYALTTSQPLYTRLVGSRIFRSFIHSRLYRSAGDIDAGDE